MVKHQWWYTTIATGTVIYVIEHIKIVMSVFNSYVPATRGLMWIYVNINFASELMPEKNRREFYLNRYGVPGAMFPDLYNQCYARIVFRLIVDFIRFLLVNTTWLIHEA